MRAVHASLVTVLLFVASGCGEAVFEAREPAGRTIPARASLLPALGADHALNAQLLPTGNLGGPPRMDHLPPAPVREFAKGLVGLRVGEAERRARERGFDFRVMLEDGHGLPLTYDLRRARINVAVENNRVIRFDGLY